MFDCNFVVRLLYGMVRYGMVNVDLYRAVITKLSNALNKLVSGEKPGFQALSKGLIHYPLPAYRYANGQTDRQTRSSQYIALLPQAK